jgi:hypothetical protein
MLADAATGVADSLAYFQREFIDGGPPRGLKA